MRALPAAPSLLFRAFLPVFFLVACSGSPQAERSQSGRFIDSAVQGLLYQSTSAEGQTDAAGRFIFLSGDLVRFGLMPGLLLGDAAVPAKAVMTPRDLFPGAGISDARVVNLARVLQSLDADRNTANGIDLRQAQGELASLPTADRVTTLVLDVAPADLASANPRLVNYLQNANRPLVSAAVAARHLECSEQDVQSGQNPDGQCAADPVVISPQAATLSVLEGQGEHVEQIELLLSAASDKPVSVNFETIAGTATAGSDFTAASGTITFPAGSTSRSIALNILGDALAEGNERLTMRLSSPLNATLASTEIAVDILDDDTVAAPAVLTLQGATLSESAGETGIKVLRQGQLDRALSIRVKAVDGSARAGEDFVRADALLTIPAQVTEFLIPLAIVQDTVVETDESFTLTLSSDDAQVSVLGSPATITIRDDDRAETLPELSLAALTAPEGNARQVLNVVATLSEPAPRALELHYRTVPGSARSSGERADILPVLDQVVMVPAGASAVELPVSVLGDRYEERDESFTVVARLAQGAERSARVTLSNDEALTLLQVGSAKLAAAPTNSQIAGEMESYAGGTRKQFFHLGGYGFGPFKLLPGYGPAPELRVGEAPLPVSNPPAGARCISPEITATNTTPSTCTDVINVRVMVLLDPKTAERIAFVTIDAIGAGNLIQDAVKAAVNRASCAMDLCIPTRNVLFGQTHTHAGADLQGLWGGVPESWRQQALVGGAGQATTLALQNSRPARLSMARGDADEFNNYRRPKYRREALHQADPTVTLLMAKADDADTDSPTLVGSLMQYAAHPTSIGNDDYKLPDGTVVRVPHPDYPLGVTEALEARFGAAGLYFNGPIADASPAGATIGSNEYERVKSRGRALAAKAFGYLAEHTVAIDPVMTVAHKEAVLPVSNPLFLSLGLLSQFNGYYQFSQVPKDDIPGFDQLPPDAVAQFEAGQNQLPQPAPTARTLVSRISLGSDDALDANKNRLEIVTIPGETTNTYGQMIRRLANESPLTDARPKRHTMLLGLTHNSFGYIIPEEEFSYVDPSGEAGFVLPGTGYEEFVSLGPLTAPLLRAQAYAPLFGVAPPDPAFLPPALTDCQVAMDFGSCFVGVAQDRLMQLLGLPEGLLASLKDGASVLAEGCHSVAGPLEPACALFDALAEGSDSIPGLPTAPGGDTPEPGDGGGDPGGAATQAYGGGVIGTLAQFGASMNTAIAAFFNGDVETAMSAGQLAFQNLGSSLAALLSGGDGPAGLASGDPQGLFGRFLGLQADPATAGMAMRPARAAEAVVMTGAQFAGWSAPAARGQGYPYPSGANITGQADEAQQLSPLNQVRDPLRVGEVRDAHNGEMIYPAAGQVIPFGAPVDEIAAYKWTGAGFEEIPVQVDEKFPFFLANAGSTFSIYSGTDPELTYAWDRENWDARDAAGNPCQAAYPAGKTDPVANLDDDDEVVFMASDAGAMAPTGELPARATQVQMVRLQDAADPQAERVVYVVRQAGGSRFRGKPTYVRYQRQANADQWIDRSFFRDDDPEILGSSNTSYGPNRKGTVCLDGSTPKASNDRFPRDGLVVETDTYRWEASGRWMIRDIRIKAPGVAKPDWAQIKNTRPDLLDRWKGRAFQQSPDSTISLVGFEDEQVNWEANSTLLGERCGPVRCMREVWGADSGTNVTKTETFYRDAVSYRYRIRVHPIPPDGLYTSWDYNRSAMLPSAAELANGVEPGRYFTALRPQGVPVDGINDDIGQVDSVAPVGGQCMTSDGPRPPDAKGRCPLFLDAADPTFNLPLAFDNWEQISGKGNSGALVYTFALKGATSLANPLVVPYYRDDACLDDGTGDDPVQRPWPGESSADSRVIAAYARNDAIERGGNGNGQADCAEQQGVYGANGIHYFATHDSDNAFAPVTATEVDGEQWQFMVPAAQPRNVGDAYANIIRLPLQAVVVPLTPP